MCDCALMGVPNRMAVEGEQLVVHRFRTGSPGLAAPLGLDSTNPPTGRPISFWVRLKLFFAPTQQDSVRAVCMPPGAQLVVEDIPESLHLAIGIGEIELVTFTRITAPGTYRDAVRFKNGHAVRLQEFHEGQHMWVMNLFPRAEASERVLDAVSRV
jgi:hypothetical protein